MSKQEDLEHIRRGIALYESGHPTGNADLDKFLEGVYNGLKEQEARLNVTA